MQFYSTSEVYWLDIPIYFSLKGSGEITIYGYKQASQCPST